MSCVDQGNFSLGETSRQMLRRIADHKGIDRNSAIFEYIFDCKYYQNSNVMSNFTVLKRCKKSYLYSLESMLIEEQNPKLNTQSALNRKSTTLSIY